MWSTYYLSVKSLDISVKNWNISIPWSYSWIFCSRTSFLMKCGQGCETCYRKECKCMKKTFCWVQKTHRAFYSSSTISVLQSYGWNFPWSLQYCREMKSQKKTCTAGYAVLWPLKSSSDQNFEVYIDHLKTSWISERNCLKGLSKASVKATCVSITFSE